MWNWPEPFCLVATLESLEWAAVYHCRKAFSAPIETDSDAGINTGIAVVNLEGDVTVLELLLTDPNGAPLAKSEIQIEANGHTAVFVDQIEWNRQIDFSEFKGNLRVLSQGKSIGATVIQTRPGQLADYSSECFELSLVSSHSLIIRQLQIRHQLKRTPANPARVPIMKTKARKPRRRFLSRTVNVSTCAMSSPADSCHVWTCANIALQVPVAGQHRFLQLERFRIEAPRFFERLVDARHYRLGPTSRSCPRVG